MDLSYTHCSAMNRAETQQPDVLMYTASHLMENLMGPMNQTLFKSLVHKHNASIQFWPSHNQITEPKYPKLRIKHSWSLILDWTALLTMNHFILYWGPSLCDYLSRLFLDFKTLLMQKKTIDVF